MNSSVNCVDVAHSPGNNVWINAFWNGIQMVYGQRRDGKKFVSMCIALDVVAHEMFHGVTDSTAGLQYQAQSGALNESFSDIFGVIVANFNEPDVKKWRWDIGAGLTEGGAPFRNMQDPTLYGQPAHMRDFKSLPITENGDYGGVHTNSGIHNKVAYLMLSAQDAGIFVLAPKEVIGIFYLALTQQLSRTSQFGDSRRGVLQSARTLFRTLSQDDQKKKTSAIERAFQDVGII